MLFNIGKKKIKWNKYKNKKKEKRIIKGKHGATKFYCNNNNNKGVLHPRAYAICNKVESENIV